MQVRDIASEEELEIVIMEFIDVLDRTRSINAHALTLVGDTPARAKIEKDNEVLLDLRNRLWRQFQPLFVADRLQ
jgi:hypothetical protein